MEESEIKIELPAMRPSRSKAASPADGTTADSETDRIIKEFNALPENVRIAIMKEKKQEVKLIAPVSAPISRIRQVHWTELYPDAAALDPETGEPRKPRPRTGGQFSLKQLTIQNKFTKETRKAVAHTGSVTSDFPIKKFEQIIDEVEVLFDFEDERDEMLQAFGGQVHDPLKLNDTGSAFEQQVGKISPPPK